MTFGSFVLDRQALFTQAMAEPLSDDLIFFDSEFLQISPTSFVPISLGLVKESASLHICMPDVDKTRRACRHIPNGEWILSTVLQDDVLQAHPDHTVYPSDSAEVQNLVRDFMGNTPIPWAYVSPYDVMVMKGVFGYMTDAPYNLPRTANDLSTLVRLLGKASDDFPRQADEHPKHNALSDARWNQRVYKTIRARLHAGMIEDCAVAAAIGKLLSLKPR